MLILKTITIMEALLGNWYKGSTPGFQKSGKKQAAYYLCLLADCENPVDRNNLGKCIFFEGPVENNFKEDAILKKLGFEK